MAICLLNKGFEIANTPRQLRLWPPTLPRSDGWLAANPLTASEAIVLRWSPLLAPAHRSAFHRAPALEVTADQRSISRRARRKPVQRL